MVVTLHRRDHSLSVELTSGKASATGGCQRFVRSNCAKRGILRHKGASCSGDQNLIYLPREHLPERGRGDGAEADGAGAGKMRSADRFRRGAPADVPVADK